MQIKVQYGTTTGLLEWLELKRLTYLQGRNKDADVENRIVDRGGGGRRGWDELRETL